MSWGELQTLNDWLGFVLPMLWIAVVIGILLFGAIWGHFETKKMNDDGLPPEPPKDDDHE